MAKNDGSVIIDTRMDTSGFGKGVKTMQSRVNGLTGAVNKLGVAIGAAFAVKKIIQFGKEAIELGSDLQEVQNVVDVTFTTMSEKVNEFAKGAAEAAGLSETMAKKYVGTFGAMAKAFGFAEGEAFNMSTSLTQLAGDVASFYNITQDEAYTKLKSVFTGETETLKDLGVVMTQSALDSYAMAEGYGKTTKQMSEQEKVALRYSFVLDQLSAAQGDFVRTSDSWANQTRILSLNFDSLKANIGQALINIFTPFLKIINQIVSKMAELSKHFVAFSEMLVGKSTSGGGGSPGDALGEITGGYEDIADATDEATKAQKNYLGGLDEIRTYTPQQTEEDKGTSGKITVPTIPEKEKVDTTNTLGKIYDRFSALIDKIKEFGNVLKSGFEFGLGKDFESSIKRTIQHLNGIKDSIIGIFTDPKVSNSALNFLKTALYAIGQFTGAIISVIQTMIEALIGGIEIFLSDNSDFMKERIVSIFDVTSEIFQIVGNLSASIASIFEVFRGDTAKQIIADLLGIFVNAGLGIIEFVTRLGKDIINCIAQPIIDNSDKIKLAFENTMKPISTILSTLNESVKESFEYLFKVYEENIAPMFQAFADGISMILGTFLDAYNEHLAPVLDRLAQKFQTVWKEHIQPAINSFIDLIGKIASTVKDLWQQYLVPLVNWLVKTIIPVLAPIVEGIGKVFLDVFGGVGDVLKSLFDILGGVVDFIGGVFTGDWEKAWNGIGDIFTGIWNGLISVVETIINGVIDIINGLIGGVNAITGTVGIPKIPEIPNLNIPKLATGAVIPPNAPFMAILGDQKRGTNIEAPLDTIKQAIREEVGSGNGNGNVLHNVVQINRRTLFDEMIDEAKLRMSTTNQNPFELLQGV